VNEVRQMDADLFASLDVAIPAQLIARLKLHQELDMSKQRLMGNRTQRRYALAASIAVAFFVGGFLFSNQLNFERQVREDYQKLLAGVVEHMNEVPITPVWEVERANRTANTLLASYDDALQLNRLENLQFTRICPMGQYRGLHGTLQTDDGQITFAYIKGESVGELLDVSYQGYLTRVKPVRGGNLIILSRNMKSLDQADRDLRQAMYWDI
ncbi:MAG: DUF3379 family protein, partial [Arenicella sp.]|nr:DUF3379 family protein [Arenicella sp.]